MRKLLASLLILCVLYQCAGYLLVFEANFRLCRKEMKRAIKAGLNEKELHHFELSTHEYDQLNWHDQHEFEWKGVMYDIVRSKTIRGTIHISCVNDKQESMLFAHLNDHIDRFSDVEKEGKTSSKLLLKLLKIQALPIETWSTQIITFKALHYKTLLLLNTSRWVISSFQPPELQY